MEETGKNKSEGSTPSLGRSAQSNRRMTDLATVLQSGAKLPPQALDLEEAVLGALMLEKSAVNDVIDILKPESFYKDSHQKIFAAILDLFAKSNPIDILTVTNELRKRGELDKVGGPFAISQLTSRIASGSNAEYYARIIVQKHILRELIHISGDTLSKAYDDTSDVFELLDQAENNLFKIAEGNIRKNYDSMATLMKKAIEGIENARTNSDGISGVPSGFTQLDSVTSGWQKSDMIVIAARPAMGKTAFVLSMARNTAVQFKKPVAIFSLEMSSVQLVNRLISSESEISGDKLRKGNLADHEFAQLHARTRSLADAPIFIDDTPAISVFELRAKARRLKQQHNIELIIIDYLQLMTGGEKNKGNREQEISTISRSIKTIAKELEIPIIALSQLSRSVETRTGDKKPQLSDLRESGAIEQDADIVAFIYRAEYYGFTQNEAGTPTKGIGEIIIAKHRNGALETVPLRFVQHYAKFENLESQEAELYQSTSAGINPNKNFEQTGTITRSSKMNTDPSETYDNDDSAPPF
jgi:replicative DNA helicase